MPLSYEITPLRDNCDEALKQRHYNNVVEGLQNALDEILDNDEELQDTLNSIDSKGYQFRSTSTSWQDHITQPMK